MKSSYNNEQYVYDSMCVFTLPPHNACYPEPSPNSQY